MDYKSFPVEIIKADATQGIIEAIVSVMGNIDHGNDRIWPGAFTKTLNERGNKVKVLDNHNNTSLHDVIGKPLSIREINSAELPQSVKERYPDATGGLYTITQFDMDDEKSRSIFNKLAKGFVNEWSIGFTIPKGKQDFDGMLRNIREVILFEYSPVIWGMNEATDTISAKDNNMDEIEEKRRSLGQMYWDVRDSFDAIYMDYEQYLGFMCTDVYDDNTLLCKSCGVESEFMYYMLGYQIIDNQYAFDPIENWQGGNFSFVIGLKSYDIIEETKQGRVLSQSNYDKIKDAIGMLSDVITAATPVTEEMSDDIVLENTDELAKSQPALTKSRDEWLQEIEKILQ